MELTLYVRYVVYDVFPLLKDILWLVICCLFQARVTDAVQFGDGFGLAGAAIIHLLGQRQQFELLDFSYHVLNVNNFER